jgi:hypothetical protein
VKKLVGNGQGVKPALDLFVKSCKAKDTKQQRKKMNDMSKKMNNMSKGYERHEQRNERHEQGVRTT